MNDIKLNVVATVSVFDALLAVEAEMFANQGLHPDSFIDENGMLAILEDRLDNPNYSSYYFPDGSPNKLIVKKVLGKPTDDQVKVISACAKMREILKGIGE